ncbi:hypothetical protein [Leuconostoc pseudomesenteroides]|uniref:hypothetical protein n=1 Tax=Leuconostoc pseudomesenteroides TaxID=33968 RepID=UPI00301DD6C9
MTETVVHVTTLEQWKSVLDVWFKQGYTWQARDTVYAKFIFDNVARYLHLDRYISYSISAPKEFIEYSEFMAQQKEDNKMATYYVTQKQLIFIESLKVTQPYMHLVYGLTVLEKSDNLLNMFTGEEEKALLRYLGGDETIEFKVKESLYRLWRIDDDGDTVYMRFNLGTPTWITNSTFAFTAPLDEIKKWQTPAWEIDKAD